MRVVWVPIAWISKPKKKLPTTSCQLTVVPATIAVGGLRLFNVPFSRACSHLPAPSLSSHPRGRSSLLYPSSTRSVPDFQGQALALLAILCLLSLSSLSEGAQCDILPSGHFLPSLSSLGDMFQDPRWMPETTGNTGPSIS